jgi:hypothetical protein
MSRIWCSAPPVRWVLLKPCRMANVVPCPSRAVITAHAGRGCRGADISVNNLARGFPRPQAPPGVAPRRLCLQTAISEITIKRKRVSRQCLETHFFCRWRRINPQIPSGFFTLPPMLSTQDPGVFATWGPGAQPLGAGGMFFYPFPPFPLPFQFFLFIHAGFFRSFTLGGKATVRTFFVPTRAFRSSRSWGETVTPA